MSRSVYYAREFEADNGHIIEFQFIPAGSAALSFGSPVEIPEDFFPEEFLGDIERSFAKQTAGAPKLGECKMTVDIYPCETSSNADLQDLAEYVTKASLANTGTVGGRSFATSTVVRILTDNGVEGSVKTPIFEGAIRRLPEEPHTIGTGSHTVEITLVDLTFLVLTELKAGDFLGAGVGVGGAKGPHQWVWDLYYKAGSSKFGRVFGLFQMGSWQPVHVFYPLTILFQQMAIAASTIYKVYRRDTAAQLAFRSALSPHPGSADTGDGNPWDHVTNYKQGYTTAAGTSGAALTRSQRYFLAHVKRSDTSDIIGGFLSPKSRVSIYGYKSMWEFLKECCESTVCKMLPIFESALETAIYFAKVKEGTPSRSGGKIPFEVTEIPDGELKPIRGRGVVAGAVGEYPGGGSDDATDIKYLADWGTEAEETPPVPSVFHNMPYNGPMRNHSYMRSDDADSEFRDFATTPSSTIIFEEPYVVVGTPSAPTLGIYYADTPDGMSVEQMFRAHHRTDIDTGDGTISTNCSVTLPTTSVINSSDGVKEYDKNFWGGAGLRALMVQIQRESCLPYTACKAFATLFGAEWQNEISLELPITMIKPSDFGGLVDDTDWPDGTAIAPSLAHWPGGPHVRSVKLKVLEGLVDTALLSIGEGS